MDHKQIEQSDLIDRYLMGKLLPEESAGLEEHFVDCPQCIARLQTTKNFLQDLRLMAAEQAAQIESQPPRGAFWHVPTRLPNSLAWAVVCLLIVAAAGTVFLVDYTRRWRAEIDQAKSLSEQWQVRYEDERQSAMAADRAHQEAEAQRAEQLRTLEAKLKEETQRTRMAAETSRPMSTDGNLPFFILNSVRGSEAHRSESVNRVDLPRSVTIFACSIPLEGETRYATYRITIFDDRQRLIWKSGGLTPSPQDALFFWLKPGLFRSGHYTLIVEGDKKAGARDAVGNYPFQVMKPL